MKRPRPWQVVVGAAIALIAVSVWVNRRPQAPASGPHAPIVSGILTAHTAYRLCQQHPHQGYRVAIRGYSYANNLTEMGAGAALLFDQPDISIQLLVESHDIPSTAVARLEGVAMTPAAWSSLGWGDIPDAAGITAHGVLYCSIAPYPLDVTSIDE